MPKINEKYKKSLPVPMTDKDRSMKGLELNERLGEIDNLELEAKEIAESYKGQITGLKKTIGAIRRSITSRTHIKQIECVNVPNFETRKIEYHRTDKPKTSPERIFDRRDFDLLDAAELAEIEAMDKTKPEPEEVKPQEKTKKASGKAVAAPKTVKPVATAPKSVTKAKTNGNGKAKSDKNTGEIDTDNAPLVEGSPVTFKDEAKPEYLN